jgi:phosphohistidine phosphatase
MKLYLMQHGDAVSKDVDPERPLSETGSKDVERLATFLSKTAFKPARIIHSGKTRARQTAELLAAQTAQDAKLEASSGLGPKDEIKPVAKLARDWTEDTLIVGHLPFMGRMVAQLVSGDADNEIVAYLPGSMVCVERADSDWRIAWMIRPELVM